MRSDARPRRPAKREALGRKNQRTPDDTGETPLGRRWPRKRFGQHFLAQPGIARRIVALAGLDGRETVLEIGPGRGALTRLLAASGCRLLLIEIDRHLSESLRGEFASQPPVQVVEGNVLDMDLRALLAPLAPVTVVANLPYNISTPVLMQLLQTPDLFSRLILMLQREVATRLSAAPGSKSYGALSVAVQLVADVRIAFPVPASAFSPRPKVESAVVVIVPFQPTPLSESARRSVRRLVRTAFSRRRKQLGNVIVSLTSDPHTILRDLGIDPRRRPETLEPADFVRLARALESIPHA